MKNINFVGMGGAFNSEKLHNASLSYIRDGHLLIIDMGETNFSIIQPLIVECSKVSVLITHTHSDHIGSLGTLIMFCYYAHGITVDVYFPDNRLSQILTLQMVEPSIYNYHQVQLNEYVVSGDYKFRFNLTEHVPQGASYGITICDSSCTIYYSGDSISIPENILTEFFNKDINFLVQDVQYKKHPGQVHMSFAEIVKIIPKKYRHRVILNHFDEYMVLHIEEIKKAKFNTSIIETYIH